MKSAFLQGQELERELFTIPVPELADLLGIPRGQVVRLKQAAYGLVQAPREWFKSVAKKMKDLGWEQLVSDSCMWRLKSKSGKLIGLAPAYVDDFLFAGKDTCPDYQKAKKELLAAFRWTEWEKDSFLQTGTRITQRRDFGFELDQSTFVTEMEEIDLPSDRRRQQESPVTERERSQLRSLLGGLQWKGSQTGPQLLAELGMLQSRVNEAKVSDIIEANTPEKNQGSIESETQHSQLQTRRHAGSGSLGRCSLVQQA